MPEVGLKRPRIVPLVGERVAAGVSKNVGMRLERKLGDLARTLDHACEAGRREPRAASMRVTNETTRFDFRRLKIGPICILLI